ncbi:UNVERIFIED_CONTAM: hypothetical protein FKN15_011948 [Acipenser sinensis]
MSMESTSQKTSSRSAVSKDMELQNQPTFGLLFDIDGVLVRGRTPIPAAKESFKKLVDRNGEFQVPVVFVTNAGNGVRQAKAELLSQVLEVECITASQVLNNAVILFGEPIRWETNLQLIVDLLLTNGYPANPVMSPPYPHIPVLACNMDLMWMAEAKIPRFGHGSFLVCLESIYKKITGKELKYEALIGKPSLITYNYAELLVRQQAKSRGWSGPIRRLYAIGDNPMADIYGANLYNHSLQSAQRSRVQAKMRAGQVVEEEGGGAGSPAGERGGKLGGSCHAESCRSILVCTGVYSRHEELPSDPHESVTQRVFHGHRDFRFDPSLVEASYVVQDVNEAVDLIFTQENWTLN